MKEFKKYYIISEEPEIVYQGLTSQTTLELWTGYKADFKAEEGTDFELFDESIAGRNIELIAGEKIVQEWYFGENEAESIVTMKLFPHKKGTSIQLIHTNIPEEAFEDIVEGWNEVYFKSLIEFYS